jgi:hypothetical protein
MVADNTVKDVFIVHRLVIKNESDPNDVETYKNRINDMLSRLIQHGKHVIYFQAVPEARIDPKLCGGELPYGRKADLSACNFPLKRELEYQRANRQLMEIWSENYSNLKVFDPSDLLCHAGLCQTIINGRTNWMDDNHLSESASYLQGDAVVKIMGVK